MTSVRLLAAALVLVVTTAKSDETQFCVTTTSELRAALAAVSDGGANQDDQNGIYLAVGTYSTADDGLGRFVYANTSATGSLHLWGGFNSDCSQMSVNASATILDGNNATQVLVARSATGYVDILNLTVQNGDTDQFGAGIEINDTGSTTGDVLLRDLIIRNNHTSRSYAVRAFARGAHVLYFDNNLVVDNSADGGYAAGELFGEGQVYVRYDTISNNSAPDTKTGGLFCGGAPDCEIANSVFWLNSNVDLYLFTDAKLYFADVGVLGGMMPSTNDHPITGDPLFVDPAAGDYHPGNGSPLLAVSTYLDSGSDNDIEGHNLPLTGTTDVGAYVDTIFNDNLEGQ